MFLQNILFPGSDLFGNDFDAFMHYFVSGVFFGVFPAIACVIFGFEPPFKAYLAFWGAGVVLGHFQYYIAKKKNLSDESFNIRFPDLYLWVAWTPFSIIMVLQAIVFTPILAFGFTLYLVITRYKNQLDKFLKID